MKRVKNIFLSAAGLINRMDPDLPLPKAFRFYRAAYQGSVRCNRLLLKKIKLLEKTISKLETEVDEYAMERDDLAVDVMKMTETLEEIRKQVDRAMP